MSAYYNELDPFAAEWLRNLIADGLIAPGDVDERSIAEVSPDDIRGYAQVHLFAGIGGWSYALRLAGWPDDLSTWTGSCPCQPFSVAGNRRGANDARHLWPHMLRLIGECRPYRVFGEQVAGAVGFGWLDGVCADLEGIGYAVGSCVLGAHSVSAPHMRQRLWWVADTRPFGVWGGVDGCREAGDAAPARKGGAQERQRLRPDAGADGGDGIRRLADVEDADRGAGKCGAQAGTRQDAERRRVLTGGGECGWLANAERDGRGPDQQGRGDDWGETACGGCAGGRRGDAYGAGLAERQSERGDDGPQRATVERAGGQWGDAWLPCSDGKRRRAKPGICPLAHGVPRSMADCGTWSAKLGNDPAALLIDARRCRMGVLKGAGNAIVPQVAAEFIKAYIDASAAMEKEQIDQQGGD